MAGCRDSDFPPRVPRRADRAHPGLVHAPGGAVASRVPGAARRRDASSTPSATRRSRPRSPCQPVRRYGVDAAILFSDIVVPLAAIGVGVEIVAGTGPVIAEPFRRAPTSTGCGRSSPSVDTPYVARDRAGPASTELDVPADRLRRSAVHRRELPRRGRPDPRPSPRTRRSCTPTRDLGSRCSTASRSSRSPRCAPRSTPGRPRSSSSTAGPARSAAPTTSASSLPATTQVLDGARATRRAADPLRRRAPASSSISWPTPAPTWSASTGACRSRRRAQRDRRRRRAAGQPRSGDLPRRASTAVEPRRAASSPRAPCAAGPHLQPRPRRAARDRPRRARHRLVDLVHEEATAP